MKVTVLSSEVTSNRTTESVVADNMYMVVGLRSEQQANFSIKFTSSRTAKRRKDNVQGTGKDANKTDMYSTYELLPDKKVPVPKVMKKINSKKSVAGQEEGQQSKKAIEEEDEEEKEVNSTAEKQADKEKTAENVSIDNQAPVKKQVKGKGILPKESDEVEKTERKSSKAADVTLSDNQEHPVKEYQELLYENEEKIKKSPLKLKNEGDITPDETKVPAEKLQEAQTPQMVPKAKTFYGRPGEKEEPKKNTETKQERPTMSRSKTTVEKPKSKACNLM